VPAPLEPAWRGAEAGRSFSSRAPLGCTTNLEQGSSASGPSHLAQVRPASPFSESGAVPAVAGSIPSPCATPHSSVTGTSTQVTSKAVFSVPAVPAVPSAPCRSVQFVNAQASFASVVPAVVAPSSPCMASCGTPQSPCRSVQFVNPQAQTLLTSASVVPAVAAPSSPCMASCGTPQSPCRSVQFVNPQAQTLLTSASVVPAVVAPSSPCMASCGTPQSPCRSVQFVNPQASGSVGLVASPCGVRMVQATGGASPAPLMLPSSVCWTRTSPQASQRDRSSSPLKCLPVKYSRQDRHCADPPKDFESLMAEARLRLKEKVDGVVSAMPPVEVTLLPSKPRTPDPEEESSRSRLEAREDNEPPSEASAPETRAEFTSLAKLEALLARSSTDESPRPQPRKSPAPRMESTEFSSLAKLEALLAETSKSESPRRRPSDLLRKSAQELVSSDFGAQTGKCSSQRSQRSRSSSLAASVLKEVPSEHPSTPSTQRLDLTAGDDYLRRPLFVSASKEILPLSRSASQDQWLYKSWRSPSRSTEGRELNEPKGADVAGGLRPKEPKASQPDFE
ncbi:unnamed protein product, partial [Cladocopium goreaui]